MSAVTDDRFAQIAAQLAGEPVVEPILPTAPVAAAWRVLSFDQSIANTGWCFITVRDGHPFVELTGHHKTPAEKGMAALLRRANEVYDEIVRVIEDVSTAYERPDFITFETPVGGKTVMGASSSLLTALAVTIAAQNAGIPSQNVASQRLKLHLTGNRGASKKEVADAIRARMPDLKERKIKPLNEHVFDAIGIALTFLES